MFIGPTGKIKMGDGKIRDLHKNQRENFNFDKVNSVKSVILIYEYCDYNELSV